MNFAVFLVLMPSLILSIQITVIGEEERIWTYKTEHCPSTASGTDNPNNSPRAFIKYNNNIEFFDSSSYGYYQRTGSSFTNLKSNCTKPLLKSSGNYSHSHPHDYYQHIWFQSPWRDPNNPMTIYAIIHNEFHGNECADQQKWCSSGSKDKCWYASGLCAYSHDGGNTFHLYSDLSKRVCFSTPYKYVPNGGRQGISPFTNILCESINDGYCYLMSDRQIPQNNLKSGMCLWRTNNLSDAAMSWRAYNTTSMKFDITNVNPYQNTTTNPEEHICDVVLGSQFRWSWSYNTVLNKYLSIGFDNNSGDVTYSVSSDLINWSKAGFITTVNNTNGQKIYTYPSVLDESSKGVNFEYTNTNPYLYFAKGDTVDRNIVRIKLNIEP
eukprot:116404_1